MSPESLSTDERVADAKASLAIARKSLEQRYAGINEREAILYARGFMKGLAAAGKREGEARDIAFVIALDDKLLDAGAAYMGHAIIEAMVSEQQ